MREEERKEIEKGEDGMKEANKEFAGQHRESKKLEKERRKVQTTRPLNKKQPYTVRIQFLQYDHKI